MVKLEKAKKTIGSFPSLLSLRRRGTHACATWKPTMSKATIMRSDLVEVHSWWAPLVTIHSTLTVFGTGSNLRGTTCEWRGTQVNLHGKLCTNKIGQPQTVQFISVLSFSEAMKTFALAILFCETRPVSSITLHNVQLILLFRTQFVKMENTVQHRNKHWQQPAQ